MSKRGWGPSWTSLNISVGKEGPHVVRAGLPCGLWLTNGILANVGIGPPSLWTDGQTHDWKHYLLTTSATGDRNNGQSKAAQFSSSKRQSSVRSRGTDDKGLHCVEILNVTESRISIQINGNYTERRIAPGISFKIYLTFSFECSGGSRFSQTECLPQSYSTDRKGR